MKLQVGDYVADKNVESGLAMHTYPWAVYQIDNVYRGRIKERKFISHHLTKAEAAKKAKKLKNKGNGKDMKETKH